MNISSNDHDMQIIESIERHIKSKNITWCESSMKFNENAYSTIGSHRSSAQVENADAMKPPHNWRFQH